MQVVITISKTCHDNVTVTFKAGDGELVNTALVSKSELRAYIGETAVSVLAQLEDVKVKEVVFSGEIFITEVR